MNGALTVGASALPATLTSGTPAAGNCAAFTSGTTTNVQDSGSPCPTQFTKFAMGFLSAGQGASSANAVNVSVIYLPNIQFSKLTVDVSTTDASGSDFYSWAITDQSGAVKCSITAVNLTAGGANDQSCTQGTVTLASGPYIFAFTGNATTAKIAYSGTAPLALVERHQQQHQLQRRHVLPHRHPRRRRNLQRLRPPRHHPPLMKGAITLSSRTHPRRLQMV